MKVIKRAFILILSLALVLICNASFFMSPKNAYAEVNALVDIQNASFEQVDAQTGLPLGWVVNQNLGENAFITQNAYDGAQYYQITDGEKLLQTQEFAEINGAYDYVFGVKFISSSQKSTCKISVSTFDSQNQLVKTEHSEQVQIKLVNAWQDVSVKIAKDENAVGVKIEITVDAEGSVGIDAVYGNVDFLTLYDGASISLETTTTAIRFSGQVGKDVFDNLSQKYDSVSVGIMLMLTDKLDVTGEFSVQGFSTTGYRCMLIQADYWSNTSTAEQDGCYKLHCSLINLGQAQLQVELCARLYVKYTENGQEKYIYSNYSVENNSRSLYSVAVMALADEQTFATYDQVQKSIIMAYAQNQMPDFNNLR